MPVLPRTGEEAKQKKRLGAEKLVEQGGQLGTRRGARIFGGVCLRRVRIAVIKGVMVTTFTPAHGLT